MLPIKDPVGRLGPFDILLTEITFQTSAILRFPDVSARYRFDRTHTRLRHPSFSPRFCIRRYPSDDRRPYGQRTSCQSRLRTSLTSCHSLPSAWHLDRSGRLLPSP